MCDSVDSAIDFNDEPFKNLSMKLAFRKKSLKYNEGELTEASLNFFGCHSPCYEKGA